MTNARNRFALKPHVSMVDGLCLAYWGVYEAWGVSMRDAWCLLKFKVLQDSKNRGVTRPAWTWL